MSVVRSGAEIVRESEERERERKRKQEEKEAEEHSVGEAAEGNRKLGEKGLTDRHKDLVDIDRVLGRRFHEQDAVVGSVGLRILGKKR